MVLDGNKAKVIQSGGFLIRFLGASIKVGLPLTKNVLASLAKKLLMPLGLTTKVSATDAAIQMNIYGSAIPTLIIKNLLKNQVYW